MVIKVTLFIHGRICASKVFTQVSRVWGDGSLLLEEEDGHIHAFSQVHVEFEAVDLIDVGDVSWPDA